MDLAELKHKIKWCCFGNVINHNVAYSNKEITVVRRFAYNFMSDKSLSKDETVDVIYEFLISKGILFDGGKFRSSYIIHNLYELVKESVRH